MRLKLAHLMQPRAKPSELFLEVTTVFTVFQISQYFQGTPLKQSNAATVALTGKCPKYFEDFIVRIRAKNSQFPCEFG